MMFLAGSTFDGQPGTGPYGGLDALTSWFQTLPGAAAAARKSALGSCGYYAKKTLKDTVNGNTAGWPALSVATRVIKSAPPRAPMAGVTHHTWAEWEAFRSAERQTSLFDSQFAGKLKFWGTLAALTVYKVSEDAMAVFFGFMSGTFGFKTRRTSSGTRREANEIREDVVGLARILTEGDPQRRTVTRQMQNYLRAIGLYSPPIGASIALPSRPLIGPHWLRIRPDLPRIFREKYWLSFARKTSPAAAFLASAADVLGQAA